MSDELDLEYLDDFEFGDSLVLEYESAGKPKWASHACGAFWRNREKGGHCSDCHLTFTSDSGFDSHRYGPYDKGRQCRSTEELTDLGWTSKPGHMREGLATSTLWSMPAATESPWGRAAK